MSTDAVKRDENGTAAPLNGENKNFIELEIDKDLAEGVYDHVHTRFPPEPNGYLHIGHAKSILLNYGLAKEYGGKFNLRFDDTNPTKEKSEFVDAIIDNVRWLGADFGDRIYYASDYFDKMYEIAVKIIRKGHAYVSDLTADEMREYRGTLTEPGRNDPNRDRSVEENLDLFERMKNGEFADGEKTLRAKIDMASPNINMRDPIIYRVAHLSHQRTGDKWCIYPMYDFAHPIEDGIEHITHSICTLEFEDHRPLYDWVVREAEFEMPPRQIEFAKLYLNNIVTGKRYIKKLVEQNIVDGWDDPRIVSVKLVIDNYPQGQSEELEAPNNLENEALGSRKLTFGRELYIERDDFMAEPVPKYKRLYPGNEVRLMYAYFVTCTSYETDETGKVTVIHCTYDPATRGGDAPDGRKVKGTIHWVNAADAGTVTARLYENIIDEEKGVYDPETGELNLNPHSLTEVRAYVEPALLQVKPFDRFQFIRNGFFCVDCKDSKDGAPVYNRIVSLKSSFKLPKK